MHFETFETILDDDISYDLLQSKGREVVDSLQFLCSNDVDVPIGTIIHTGMQNQHGGYENDCSLIRMAENK